MKFLTETEMDLLQFINLSDERFKNAYNHIYGSTNTHDFGDVILKIRTNYAKHSNKKGKYTVRYILLNLREEIMEALLPNQYNYRVLSEELYITSRSYPFEKKPFISNMVGRKTSKSDIKDIIEIVDDKCQFEQVLPYLKIEKLINETGELFFDKKVIASDEAIKKYNGIVDSWEQKKGFMINEKEGIVSIDAYESTTLYIMQKLLEYKSVKVVIPSSNAERITHAIFYTAITRAKEQLKIFWSPETMDAIVKSFSEQKVEHRTLQLIKEKLNLLGK